jgi:hypothetical protein
MPSGELARLLTAYRANGGVLDFVFFETAPGVSPSPEMHRTAALEAMAAIDRGLEQWAADHASEQTPFDWFYRVHWDETKLEGGPVFFETFWGTDDVEPKPIGERAWNIPTVDGYKTAFFHPPHGLRGYEPETSELFASINQFVLGDEPAKAQIFSWSTDWSNYFEAGHEWWGAFFWTVHPAGTTRLVAIGASATD